MILIIEFLLGFCLLFVIITVFACIITTILMSLICPRQELTEAIAKICSTETFIIFLVYLLVLI